MRRFTLREHSERGHGLTRGPAFLALGAAGLLLAAMLSVLPSSPLPGPLWGIALRRLSAIHANLAPPAGTVSSGAEAAPAGTSAATAAGDAVAADVPAQTDVAPAPVPVVDEAPSYTPITRLRVDRIKLDAEVVEAPLVEVGAGTTWQVPAFKIGHGENSADAGEPGNAVLLGHVTSTNAGNVFRDLRLMRSGDLVQVFGGPEEFDYVVTQVRSVPRTDVSVLQPTELPSITLLTCSGVWLPAIGDYTERLIVRAQLVPRG